MLCIYVKTYNYCTIILMISQIKYYLHLMKDYEIYELLMLIVYPTFIICQFKNIIFYRHISFSFL